MSSITHDNCEELKRLMEKGYAYGHDRSGDAQPIKSINALNVGSSVFLRFSLPANESGRIVDDSFNMKYCFECGKELINNTFESDSTH
ncbi:MAG: hypothetical protein M3M88_03750 [Thermoproteota archaeon]|nr:hypothetical protein [Thermoproteota archaeon]